MTAPLLQNAAHPPVPSPANSFWQAGRFRLSMEHCLVMGIVNLTPDSFSDGGRLTSTQAALAHGEQLLREGADLLDFGGESTRPGSPAVPLDEELRRVLPVVRQAVSLGVPISVDTYKPEVMQAVLDAGADVINDIRALREPGAVDVVAAHPSCGVCLMHMHRDPQTMQVQTMEGDVVPQVEQFLLERTQVLRASGVSAERIVWDAGIGFGKTVAQNFALLAHQQPLLAHGFPLLAGWSRKSSLGAVTGLPVDQRVVPSVVAAVLAAERGARIVRVHDVAATVAGLRVLNATISA